MTHDSRWRITRSTPTGRDGMVAAKTPEAVEAGLEMLRRGGNAIDAAVATAFAAGVAEPMMSGIGGGGFMVAHLAGAGRSVGIEYPMVAPGGATEDMFPLSGGTDAALFGWPSVQGQANVLGHRSVAIPGTVAGLALALERYGTLSLADTLEPAIRLARDGVNVHWFLTYLIARDLANIARFPATAATYLSAAGAPPVTLEAGNRTVLRQPDLAATLEGIAANGPRWFYDSVGPVIAAHLAEHGGTHTADDFGGYRAREVEPREVAYRDTVVSTAGGGSGGTTLAQILLALDHIDITALGHNTPEALHVIAQIARRAYADRFTYLADPDHVEVPIDALLHPEYIAEIVADVTDDLALMPLAGTRERLGVAHALGASVASYMRDGSTTHLSTADRAGNVVSITQTLLSAWGSRVTAPGSGVLLNNGMMWFDPEPGRPNSVGGGKRPLSNMAPLVIRRGDRAFATLGSSGGRKITICNAQLAMNLVDHGMTMQGAIAAPRIDTSTVGLLASDRMPAATRDRLAALGHEVVPIDETLLLGGFASPVGIRRSADGELDGGADPYYYTASVGAV